jgi:membrane-associated phospholipid phosphatase
VSTATVAKEAVEERAAATTRWAVAPMDVWILGYVGFASLILGLRWSYPIPSPGLLLLGHALMVSVVLLAARLRASRPQAWLASFYPLGLLSPFYSELGILNVAQGISHDALVQVWEAALFGGQPSHDWIRAQPWPVMSWVLHVAYLSYYGIILGAPLGLWLGGRREAATRTVYRIIATFIVCYVFFLLFPVAGPRYLFPLAKNAATEVAPAVMTHDVLRTGSSWGTAFPSSHVAVALVAGVSATAAWPAFGVVLLVDAVLLTFGTVYGQFHYAVDALAGAVIALIMVWLLRARKAP